MRSSSAVFPGAEESPYRVSLYAVRDFEESQETIRQIVAMKKADGIIISGTRADDPRIRLMQEAEFPFVTYGMSIHNAPHAYVDADNAQMIRLSMARLIERGHRRIALLNPKEQFTYGVFAWKAIAKRSKRQACPTMPRSSLMVG